MDNDFMIVIAFAGPSAAGKSTAIKSLSSKYNVLVEKYMELNVHKLDNRLVLSKWAYIDHWFDSILEAKRSGKDLLITDRFPFDTCAYVNNGSECLLDLLKLSISELKELGIVVRPVLAYAEFDILQKRITKRLQEDSQRLRYNEADINHNKRAFDFYFKNESLWDFTINTSSVSFELMPDLFEQVIIQILNEYK